jgi:TRAP transporter TAXI family solute receptor
MAIRNRTRAGFAFGFFLLLAFALGGAGPSAAQDIGLAAKKPVVAAACKLCPWGAIADVLKESLRPAGYDLQICYTCSRGNNPRYVVGTMKPPQTDPEGSPPPPNGPIEFGITSGSSVQWMYEGSHDYAKDGGHKEIRLIARVDAANYAVMMVKASTGITDVRQIKDKKLPVRIITTESAGNMPILKYYGITKKEVESWGGSYVHFVGTLPEDPDAFDVVIMNNLYLGGAPEMRPYYLITARNDMRFLPMPQDLREALIKENGGQLVNIPTALFRGVDAPVPSVGTSSRAVYAKDDFSADFAYTIAKSLDENRDLFRWTHVPFTYDSRLVTKLPPVPLHPGAERYYREVGYAK